MKHNHEQVVKDIKAFINKKLKKLTMKEASDVLFEIVDYTDEEFNRMQEQMVHEDNRQ